MKKLFTLFAAFVALFALSCEEQTIPEETLRGEMVEISVVAKAEEEADDSRVAINGNTTTWEKGDCITLSLTAENGNMSFNTLEIKSASDISSNGKKAIFRGVVPSGSYLSVAALYPAVDEPSRDITLDRNAKNNLYMLSHQINYGGAILTVQPGTKVEVPLTFNHLMHKMDFNLTLADGYTSNDLESENIIVEFEATSASGNIKFTETMNLNILQNLSSVITSTERVQVRSSKPQFSAMVFPANDAASNYKDVVFTFGVYIDGEKRYEIRKPDSGTISSFRMSAGKTTTVNLELSKANSVTGGGEIEVEPITLKASKTQIKANGTDSATLSVVKTNGGEDVTSQATIYVNGSVLQGSVFTTTSAGTYSLYAERYGERSETITIVAEEVADSGKQIVFAEGVTISSGWYDVNKKGEGANGDINMCWAAASSNMIQWFQDRYVAAGKSLPAGAVTGPGTKSYGSYGPYELALMEIYHSDWDNSKGGHPEEAIPWYFEGKLYGGEYASDGSQAYPKTSGGYWSSVWSSVTPYLYRGYKHDIFPSEYPNMYTYCYNNYYLWGNGSGLTGTDRLEYFTNLVVQAFNRGIAGLTVSLSSNLYTLHHAVTLWGYEIDKYTGLLTRVWITDSDDLTKEPKQQLLNEYRVSIGSGTSHIQLTGDTRYGSMWVVSLHPFSGYGSAGK